MEAPNRVSEGAHTGHKRDTSCCPLVGPEGGLVARFSADEPSAGIASALKALIESADKP